MVRALIVTAIVLLGESATRAEPDAVNAAYVEWNGAPEKFSFHYERVALTNFAARIGFAYTNDRMCEGGFDAPWINGCRNASMVSGARLWQVPFGIAYLGIRKRHNALELAGGGAITHFTDAGSADRTSAYAEIDVGYRYQPVDPADVQFRIGLAVAAGNFRGFGILPYLSLGFGF